MNRRKLTPQQKKSHCYAKDFRDCYGESDKGARKTVKRRKRWVNRTFRRGVAQGVRRIPSPMEEKERDLIEANVNGAKRKYWKKCPGMRLDDYVQGRKRRRVARIGAKSIRRRRQLDTNLNYYLTIKDPVEKEAWKKMLVEPASGGNSAPASPHTTL